MSQQPKPGGIPQVRVHGPEDVRVDTVAPPVPGPFDAVVDVAACGVCGSDLGYIRMGGLAGPSGSPMPLGHEAAGVVAQVGAEVKGVRIGDRVVVRPGNDELGRIGNGTDEGGLTSRLLIRDADRRGLPRVPDHLPLEVAALTEPVAVGMHAVEQADVEPTDSVAVFGCGPIGLAAIATLVDRGARDVVAVDPNSHRRKLARALGADAALDPGADAVWAALAERHGSTPFSFGPTPATDVYLEASGAPTAIDDVIANARPGGRLVVVALHYEPVPVNFLLVLMKQLTIRGSIEYPDRFEDALDLLTRRDLTPMITHRVPLTDFADAVDLLRDASHCGKVLITMGSGSAEHRPDGERAEATTADPTSRDPAGLGHDRSAPSPTVLDDD